MGFPQFVRAVRRLWWLVLISLLVFAGIGVGLAYGLTPRYASTVTFYVSTPAQSSTNPNPLTSVQAAQQLVPSYANVLTSDLLGSSIAKDSSLGLSAREIASRITTSVQTGTVTLTATVQDTSERRALTIAQALATTFPKAVGQVDPNDTTSGVTLSVINGPRLLAGQVFPKKKVYIGLGVIVGLFVGLVLVFMRELFRTSEAGDDPGSRRPRPSAEPTGEGQHRSESGPDLLGEDYVPWRGQEQPVGRGAGLYRQDAGWTPWSARAFGPSGARHRTA